MSWRPAQQGVALITAILVVALAAIAAAAVMGSAMIAVHRAGNVQDSEKAWWYADGVESWLKSVLERDAQDNKTDSLKDDWAKPVDYLPVDEGFVRGTVIDLEGRFNLNNLGVADPVLYGLYADQFERLVQSIDGASSIQGKALAAAIHDWIDADQSPIGMDGAEDTEYLNLNPPYRTANRYLESTTELMAIKGMDPKVYPLLRDYVAALPQLKTPININTAPEAVLRSLFKQTNPDLEKFIRDRVDAPADNTQAIQVAAETPGGAAGITVSSSFFMSRVETVIGSGRLALYSFYYRPAQGAAIVLGRSTDTE